MIPSDSGPPATRKPLAKRFRVAFSFAGENRCFVAKVAAFLAAELTESAILYDKYHEAEFARRDLGFHLPGLYHDESDLVVVVICAHYERKEWCGLEWDAIFDLVKQRKNDAVMLCRFDRAELKGINSTAGFVDLDEKTPIQVASLILQRLALNEGRPKDFYLTFATPVSETDSSIAAQAIVEGERKPVPPLGLEPREIVSPFGPGATRSQLPPAVQPPPRNPRFLARTDLEGADLLTRLLETPKSVHRVVLHGMSGVGKTQLALEYAHRVDPGASKEVYWTVADTEDQFLAGLSGIAGRLNLPADRPPTEILGAIHARLEAADPWLWVIDNAYSPSDIARKYLPKPQAGRVLITTTRAKPELRGIDAQVLELTRFFDPVDGARFLAGLLIEKGAIDGLSKKDQDAAVAISEEVSGLPLALDQAAAYIDHTGGSAEEYLVEYRRRLRGPVLRATRTPIDDDHRDHPTVTRTFSMLSEQVEREKPASADLLRLCAFLAADAIPEELLTLGAPELGEPLRAAIEESLPEARHAALRARLLETNPAARTLRVHRIVQDVLRDLMPESEKAEWSERAVRAVNRSVAEVERLEPEVVDRFMPQLEACATLIVEKEMKSIEAGRVLDKAGCFRFYRARYTESLDFLNKAREITEATVGQDSPEVARTLNNLAILLQTQAKYAEAELLVRRALSIRESKLGRDHPDTATSLNNLAGLLQTQAKYADAELLFRRALTICESKLGRDHPNTASSLNNLAFLLKVQAKYAEAEPLYRRALIIRESQLGHDHPETATNLGNLAGLLRAQGKYLEAEPLYRRALTIDESQLGPDHPDTAKSLANLAGLLHDQGKYTDAEPLFRAAWEILVRALGPKHETSESVLKGYLFVLCINGRRAAYKRVLAQVEPARAEVLRRAIDAVIKADKKRRGL